VGEKRKTWDVRSQNKRRENSRNKKAKKMLDTQIREKMRIAYTTTKNTQNYIQAKGKKFKKLRMSDLQKNDKKKRK